MIEIIQETEKTEDKQEAKLPRNIRQIGHPEKDFRIYMEDYVYTYLHPAQLYGCEIGVFPRMLILVGKLSTFPTEAALLSAVRFRWKMSVFPRKCRN